ncbi:MAG: hypothetical protein O7B26_14295 [Planctomycetota bacterium]|nr:hypothetical protein [Planctomycetota bacterium]
MSRVGSREVTPLPTNTHRRHYVLAVLLVLLLIGARLPVLNHPSPVHSDESEFLAAIGFPTQYPVHHPGYPAWVALGTLGTRIGFEPYAAYQLWSVIASAVAPVLLYLGLRKLIHDATAWWLALAFGVNPLVWFTAATALNYVAGVVFGLVIVGACWQANRTRRPGIHFLAVITLAFALFLRPDLLLWLGPMVVFTAWRFKWGHRIVACVGITLAFAALFALVSWLHGRDGGAQSGPKLSHTADVVFGTSIFRLGLKDGFARSLLKFCANLTWDFGLSSFLIVAAVVRWKHVRQRWPGTSTFLLLWVVPISGFVLLVHMSEPGHIMLLIPAGYCVMGLGLTATASTRTATRLAAAAAICSVAQFTLYPWSPESTGYKRTIDAKISYMSASGLRQIDRRAEIHTPGDYWSTQAHRPATRPARPERE